MRRTAKPGKEMPKLIFKLIMRSTVKTKRIKYSFKCAKQ